MAQTNQSWYQWNQYEDQLIRPLTRSARPYTVALNHFGKTSYMVTLGLAACFYFRYDQKQRTPLGIQIATQAALLGSGPVNWLLKLKVRRPRPDQDCQLRLHSASFPSGHAQYAATLAAVVYLRHQAFRAQLESSDSAQPARKSWPVLIGLWAGSIGMSRILLGAHFPTDVIAGQALGIAWSKACFSVFAKNKTKK